MKNTIDIYNLLPEEINEAIKKLTAALEVVKYRKNTNSKFVDEIKSRFYLETKNRCDIEQVIDIVNNLFKEPEFHGLRY